MTQLHRGVIGTGVQLAITFLASSQIPDCSVVTAARLRIYRTSKPAIAILGATNTSPIVITTDGAHKLTSAMVVDIGGVLGNEAANGNQWTPTILSATTFSIPVAGTGAFVASDEAAATGSEIVAASITGQTVASFVANYTTVAGDVSILDTLDVYVESQVSSVWHASAGYTQINVVDYGT